MFVVQIMDGRFGGSTISLVKCGKESEVENIFKEKFKEKFGKEPGIIRVNIDDGVC